MKLSTISTILLTLQLTNLAAFTATVYLKDQSEFTRVLPLSVTLFITISFHLYLYLKLRSINDKDLSVSNRGSVQLRKSALNKEKVVINGRKVYPATLFLKPNSIDELIAKVKNEKNQIMLQLQNEETVLLKSVESLKSKA